MSAVRGSHPARDRGQSMQAEKTHQLRDTPDRSGFSRVEEYRLPVPSRNNPRSRDCNGNLLVIRIRIGASDASSSTRATAASLEKRAGISQRDKTMSEFSKKQADRDAKEAAATLRIRHLSVDTHPDSIAMLPRSCTAYRHEDFRALRKVRINAAGRQTLANLIVIDDPNILAFDELGLGDQAFQRLGAPEGASAVIQQATPPRSLDFIRSKIRGSVLSEREIAAIIEDIAAHRYSPVEIAAWLISSASFMTAQEILDLTRAMARVGTRLRWSADVIVDKHCIGGVPGNRTSMIVTPVVAAHGLKMPKTSSRAITSPAGTADTMEVLAEVDLSIERMQEIVEQENACLVWGGHVNLSPADDVLIAVERPLGIDTPEQMVASILSKKLAAGSTHLLVDIPVGPRAKIRTQNDAIQLRKLFEYVGREIGLTLQVVLTDGSQPIGRGIGPALEARDVMEVLRGDPRAPQDLRDRALLLAGQVLDFDPVLPGGAGHARAKELLESGAALASMERIIDAQGRQTESVPLGALTLDVAATADGVVTAIDGYRLARIARLAGAPIDKGAGIDLFRKIGEPVRRDEPLYRIHACIGSDFGFASDMAAEDSGITVSCPP